MIPKSLYVVVAMVITGNCTAGYYCNHTSSQPDQHMCPAGHYCPLGTDVPIGCPAGTYASTTFNTELGDCLNCTGGMYCDGEWVDSYSADHITLCLLTKQLYK